MNVQKRRRLFACAAVLLIAALMAALGLVVRGTFIELRQREAENILHFYSESIQLKLRGNLNEADTLAQMALLIGFEDGAGWFEEAVAPTLAREEVRYAFLVEGDTIASALPREVYAGQVGRDLKDLSYIYTLAKVVKDLVVEGPVLMEPGGGDPVFLFLRPFVEEGAYLGEVVVALDSAYVLDQIGMEFLAEWGYDYELWRVDPQTGGKEVIAVSQDSVDFSHAAKTSFHLPTQWNLSIQPMDGWISAGRTALIAGACLLLGAVLLALVYALSRLRAQGRVLARYATTDRGTGLYDRRGFIAALDRFNDGSHPVVLFYLAFEGYDQVSLLLGPDDEAAFLQSIPQRLEEYVQSPFLAGRIGAGSFLLAVGEDMDEVQREDFARGLSLELLWRIRLGGEKSFLTARYQYLPCDPEGGHGAEDVSALLQAYYDRLSQESPVRALTEKCRQLVDGQSDVIFDEYTDLAMMELSKTFNQYRKQVEQLAYFDPVFNVGNRPKYLRDAKMLISYDKKRPFSLFCVDIRDFSQYNELFSANVGDQILREAMHRLSRPLGTYLYRINGDVFLGISLSGEAPLPFARRLRELLAAPVTAGNATFDLRVRIAVCQYPDHGDSPEALLERIQSALRYAKEADRDIVVYNDALDDAVRTEARILRRLKDGIRQETLEVWYQPINHLDTGRFTAVEALVRLPDGSGGHFPAGQVIALAERSGIVEVLGDYVLTHACGFLCRRGDALGLEHINVNLSVQQLLVGNSADHLLRLIRSAGADTGRITLEITESILIQSLEGAKESLDQLREAGIRIALDDFGVGFSSLNYLSNLPVDTIKIDRSLTQQIRTDPKQYTLLKTVVEMAQINSLTVVAEGVETEEEQRLIAASGVQFIQGFFYARPMPEGELEAFLGAGGL